MAVLGRARATEVESALVRLACVVLMGLAAGGCRTGPAQWGPFRGQIVDAESGAPIPGAHMMVSWERDNPNPVHWTQSFYDAQEAVTDADGRFEVPRQRRFFTLLVAAPRFAAFAPGYTAETEEVIPPGDRLYVDETVLRMRLVRTREERCRRLPGSPSIEASEKAPRFRSAVLAYRSMLSCSNAVEDQQ